MPLYIDIHEMSGFTLQDVAGAHAADMAVQDKYGVNYQKYWVNQSKGKIFCLCSAPSVEAARRVHVEAHGMVAERIIEVDPDMVETFLGGNVVADSGAALLPQSQRCDPGLRTIVFTDIVGSTAMTQKLGDRAAMMLLDLHDGIVRGALGKHGGREVKHLGDGIMAAFVSAHEAVRCAASIQSELRDVAPLSSEPVRLRIGAAAGEPVERQGDFFGSTVQLAARLCSRADPGQTLVSSSVRELCDGIPFRDVGDVSLKGFADPVRAHALVDS
jgi:class 3 adenylate cyclase